MHLNSILAFNLCIILASVSCISCSKRHESSYVQLPPEFLQLFDRFELGGYGLKRKVKSRQVTNPAAAVTSGKIATPSPAPFIKPVHIAMKPVQTAIQAAMEPVQPIIKPVQPSIKLVQTTIQPVQTSIKPVQAVIKPAQTAIKPAQTAIKPAQTAIKPAQTAIKPAQTAIKPAQTAIKPVQAITSTATTILTNTEGAKKTKGKGKDGDDSDDDTGDDDVKDDPKSTGKKPISDTNEGVGKNPVINANTGKNTKTTASAHIIHPTYHFDIQNGGSIPHKSKDKPLIVVQNKPEHKQDHTKLPDSTSTAGTTTTTQLIVENKILAALEKLMNGKPSAKQEDGSVPTSAINEQGQVINIHTADKAEILKNALVEKLHKGEAPSPTPAEVAQSSSSGNTGPVQTRRGTQKSFTQEELTVLWVFSGLLAGLAISGAIWALCYCNKDKKDSDDPFGGLRRTPPLSPVFMEMSKDKKTGKYVVNLHESKRTDESSEEEMFNASIPNYGRQRAGTSKSPNQR